MEHADYAAVAAAIREQLLAYAAEVWAAATLDDEGLARLVELMVPTVQAAQEQIASYTSVYFGEATGTDPVAVSSDVVGGRGVPAEQVYARPIVTARTELARGKSVEKALDAGGRRLQNLAGTDVQMAKVRQADVSLQAGGAKFFRRVLTGRENCGLCVIASTQRYRRGNLMPIHPGCVPGDSAVSLPPDAGSVSGEFAWGSLNAISRRLFEGELIEFSTASGDQVRVTPNHPVLTDKGWIPAHLLGVGDAVFRRSRSNGVVGRGPEVDQGPARIEDLFDAARVAFPLVRVPLAAQDFHGDGADGEVDIVYIDRDFSAPGNALVSEHVGESRFVNAHGWGIALPAGGALGLFRPRLLTPGGGEVRGGALGGALFVGHLRGAELSGAGTPPRFDAPANEFGPETVALYASRGLDLIGRLSGDVERDSVIHLRRVGFSGHVFNLHTSEGWYSANNHIVSNCDCDVDVLPRGMDLDQVIDVDLLNSTHDQVKAFAGVADRGGRAPDYRKLIVTHEHGEVGPVLAWRGQQFTSKADLK
ncbi:hypothetical protein [Mycolicibacterium houstonense]|uniref:hypothetical protein n=1 Tax=Mycolicibacterium houstonense TaxID=146021 RepID=UPI000A883BE0|nr:hypothetical protein [Mycolicibacterium houstonense]